MERKAYGKINLGLSVLGRRPDGYHQVDMIMQSISLADTVSFAPGEGLSLVCDNPDLPCDGSNLMVKAARAFSAKTGLAVNWHLACTKRIFLAAGLAGGSTDAAAVLRGAPTTFAGSPWTGRPWRNWRPVSAATFLSVCTEAPRGPGDGGKR